MLREFFCDTCTLLVESLEKRGAEDSEKPCGCGGRQRRCMSAPRPATVWGAVATGKSDERPPGVMDTSALADGMPYTEWRKKRDNMIRDERYSALKQAMG